ncbi:MAG TPA: prepilin peptidase [bacterium]|nr:prepilin peptidase [bacterium]
MHSTDWFFLAIVGVTGTIFGSFFSVVVHRLRTGESGFLTGSSHCPLCGHTLSVRDLVPVFSWLASRGHCRYCAGGIPASYLLMEAVSGLSAVLLSWGLSWSYHVPPSMLPTFGEWWWTMGTLFVLFPVAWYDIRHMEIPDEIIRPATTVILLVQLIAWQFDWPLPFFGFFNTGH